MRVFLIALILVSAGAVGLRTSDAHAVADHAVAGTTTHAQPAGIDIDVDGNDEDDLVEVQLLVLGIVVGTVFVLGTGAYLLRRKLGLTAYTPPADSGHH